MVVRFEVMTDVEAPAEQVFDRSLDVGVHLDSMAHARERAVAGRRDGMLALGETVTWRAWHFGVPWTMTSRIVELDRPRRFVDEQVAGPFASFRHVHDFEAVGGRTRMTDTITFTAPLGPIGRVVERFVLERRLVALIQHRNRHLRRVLER